MHLMEETLNGKYHQPKAQANLLIHYQKYASYYRWSILWRKMSQIKFELISVQYALWRFCFWNIAYLSPWESMASSCCAAASIAPPGYFESTSDWSMSDTFEPVAASTLALSAWRSRAVATACATPHATSPAWDGTEPLPVGGPDTTAPGPVSGFVELVLPSVTGGAILKKPGHDTWVTHNHRKHVRAVHGVDD